MITAKKLTQFLSDTYQDKAEEVLVESAAVELVRMGALSSRRAAELLEMSNSDFDDVLSRHNVPTLDITLEELREEDNVFKRLKEQ